MAADAVAHGKDGLETVVFDVAGRLPAAFSSNYSETPNSCPRGQFALIPDAFQVLVHGWHRHLEQFGDLRLRQPDRLVLQPALDTRSTILRLVEEDLGLRERIVGHDVNGEWKVENGDQFLNIRMHRAVACPCDEAGYSSCG